MTTVINRSSAAADVEALVILISGLFDLSILDQSQNDDYGGNVGLVYGINVT